MHLGEDLHRWRHGERAQPARDGPACLCAMTFVRSLCPAIDSAPVRSRSEPGLALQAPLRLVLVSMAGTTNRVETHQKFYRRKQRWQTVPEGH